MRGALFVTLIMAITWLGGCSSQVEHISATSAWERITAADADVADLHYMTAATFGTRCDGRAEVWHAVVLHRDASAALWHVSAGTAQEVARAEAPGAGRSSIGDVAPALASLVDAVATGTEAPSCGYEIYRNRSGELDWRVKTGSNRTYSDPLGPRGPATSQEAVMAADRAARAWDQEARLVGGAAYERSHDDAQDLRLPFGHTAPALSIPDLWHGDGHAVTWAFLAYSPAGRGVPIVVHGGLVATVLHAEEQALGPSPHIDEDIIEAGRVASLERSLRQLEDPLDGWRQVNYQLHGSQYGPQWRAEAMDSGDVFVTYVIDAYNGTVRSAP